MLHLHAESMPYAILRTAKLKSFGEIGGSLAHTYRTRQTPNADPTRAHLNEHQGESAQAVSAAIRARLPDTRRADAVLCVEYFIGASPEFFGPGEDGTRYFERATAWLKQRHGAENVVGVSVHRDETSPHLIAYVVPIDDRGKLNAKHFLGGRSKLSKMQTDFAANVGASVGLERGIEGSKATHTTIRQYYRALSQPDFTHGRLSPAQLAPKVLEKRLLSKTVESPEQIADRVTRSVQRYYGPALQQASTATLEHKRAREMAATAKRKALEAQSLRERLEEVERQLKAYQALFLDGLSPDQQQAVIEHAGTLRKQNAHDQEQAVQESARRSPKRRSVLEFSP